MDAAAEVREAAIRMLARREHAVRELQRKLQQKGYDSDAVADVAAALQCEGLLSDERYAEMLVRSRVGRGVGPLRIRAELQEQGVEASIIEQALEASEVEWHLLATQVRRKRFGVAMPREYRERARQSRFLQYRGFSGEQIRSVFNESEFDD